MNNQTENKREKGNKAEELAVSYLIDLGYKIVKRNFHFGKISEIDIIAEKNGTLSFVEVRSRQSNSQIDPLLTINNKKRQSIRKAAEGYLYVNKITSGNFSLDVIIIDSTFVPPKIDFLINAF